MSATAGRVLRDLRHDILSGALPQGMRLTEPNLSSRYGVSRVPVREALRTLAAEGFVDMRPYLGATVASMPADEADDLYAVRGTIEEITARRCALLMAGAGQRPVEDRSDADRLLGRLNDIVETGLAAVAAGRAAELPDLNTRFHLTMAEMSGSVSLLSLLRQVADRIQWIYASNVSVQGGRSWTEHRGIVDAIGAGDELTATALVREHIANSRRGFLSTAESDGATG